MNEYEIQELIRNYQLVSLAVMLVLAAIAGCVVTYVRIRLLKEIYSEDDEEEKIPFEVGEKVSIGMYLNKDGVCGPDPVGMTEDEALTALRKRYAIINQAYRDKEITAENTVQQLKMLIKFAGIIE